MSSRFGVEMVAISLAVFVALFCFTFQSHIAAADQSERSGIARSGDISPDVKLAAQEPLPTNPAGDLSKENEEGREKQRAHNAMPVVNRPANINGLTGLMVTTSAYTPAAKDVAAGVSVLYERSTRPGYNVLQIPATITYGLTDFIEIGLKTKFARTEYTTAASQSGAADTELAVKWRLNTRDKLFPELAVGVAGILPTRSNSKGLNDAKKWGTRIMAMASSEITMSDSTFIGLYLEAQAVFIDQGSRSPNTDRYAIANAGVLVPISRDNRLQGMLEYNRTLHKKDNPSLLEVDQVGVTPAVRYVAEKLNITAGAQILNKNVEGYKDTVRWIVNCGYTF